MRDKKVDSWTKGEKGEKSNQLLNTQTKGEERKNPAIDQESNTS
jgi:hypothetical protein